MNNSKSLLSQENAQRLSATVHQEHDALRIKLRDHTWISIFAEDQEIVSEYSPEPIVEFNLPPGVYILHTDGVVESAISKKRSRNSSFLEQAEEAKPLFLKLLSNAPDQHIIDGIGEIPADGASFCTITIDKQALDGTPLTTEDDNDELFLRTTGGLIMDADGKQHIRSLTLQSGRAQFRLVSEPTPRFVTVTVFGRQPQLEKAEIQIEFV